MGIENSRVLGIENGRVLGTESGRVGPLSRGGSGAVPQGGAEAIGPALNAMAFEDLLPPESASFAGQAAISRPLACQNTLERILHQFSSQGPQVPPLAPLSCGMPERRARRG